MIKTHPGANHDEWKTLRLRRFFRNQVIAELTNGLGADDVIVSVGSAKAIDGKALVYPHRRAGEILPVARWTGADEQSYLAGNGANS